MEWSKKPPKEEGWYWHWRSVEDGKQVIYCFFKKHHNREEPYLHAIHPDDSYYSDPVEDYGGWWMGPMDEPEIPEPALLETLEYILYQVLNITRDPSVPVTYVRGLIEGQLKAIQAERTPTSPEEIRLMELVTWAVNNLSLETLAEVKAKVRKERNERTN